MQVGVGPGVVADCGGDSDAGIKAMGPVSMAMGIGLLVVHSVATPRIVRTA